MRILITGGAGFIGPVLARSLKEEDVTIIDNLSTGKLENIKGIGAKFIKGDMNDKEFVLEKVKGFDMVFHLAANVDVRKGAKDVSADLSSYLATYNLLGAMRKNGIRKIAFTSSSTVYGEATVVPTPESYSRYPISLYGASKLSCEGLISAYCRMFSMQAWIFRLANIIGENCHGIIGDFIAKLKKNPEELEILGDGKQEKSYLLVDDCVSGILHGVKHSQEPVNIFNIGSDDTVTADRIADIITEEAGLRPKYKHTGGERGWPGDVRKFLLDASKLKKTGWSVKHNSEESVRLAARKMLGKI